MQAPLTDACRRWNRYNHSNRLAGLNEPTEDEPVISGGSPDAMTARLAYGSRDVEEQLALIELVRKQMDRILRALTA